MRRIAAFAVLLTTVAATPVLAGCGASDAIDPAVVANAADRTAGAGGARMAIDVRMGGQSIHGDGFADMRARRMLMKMGVPGAGGSMELRMIGTTMYMHFPAQVADKLPGGKAWMSLDMDKLLRSKGLDMSQLQTTGGDASRSLDQLRGAGKVTKVGTDTIRGTKTTHYKATVDLRKAAERAPATTRKAARAGIEQIIKMNGGRTTMPLDVWLDDAGRVRREAFKMQVQGNDVVESMDLYDFGTRQAVLPPPASQTTDFTDQALKTMGG